MPVWWILKIDKCRTKASLEPEPLGEAHQLNAESQPSSASTSAAAASSSALWVKVRVAATLAVASVLGTAFAAEVQPKGYLSKTSPVGLRFSPPPKPPVLSIGAQPGTYTPPPVFVKDFLSPTNAPAPVLTNALLPRVTLSVPPAPVPESSTNQPTNSVKAVESPLQTNALQLQVLVKYFAETNANPRLAKLGEPINFRMPVPATNRLANHSTTTR